MMTADIEKRTNRPTNFQRFQGMQWWRNSRPAPFKPDRGLGLRGRWPVV